MLLSWALFWVITVALIGIVVTALIALIRFSRKKKPIFKSYWFGIPFGFSIMPFLVLLSLIAVPWGLQKMRPAASDFDEVFGEKPSTEIKNLKSDLEPGLDSRAVYLAFDRSDAAWSEAMRLTGNRTSGQETDLVGSQVYQNVSPSWWQGGPKWLRKNGCANQRVHSLMNVNGWDDIVIIDCVSDQHIYVLAMSLD